MLKIRLLRTGKKKQASYRVIVKEAKDKRDGTYRECIGQYYTVSAQNKTKIDKSRYDYWVSKGAQATRTVRNIYQRLYGRSD